MRPREKFFFRIFHLSCFSSIVKQRKTHFSALFFFLYFPSLLKFIQSNTVLVSKIFPPNWHFFLVLLIFIRQHNPLHVELFIPSQKVSWYQEIIEDFYYLSTVLFWQYWDTIEGFIVRLQYYFGSIRILKFKSYCSFIVIFLYNLQNFLFVTT